MKWKNGGPWQPNIEPNLIDLIREKLTTEEAAEAAAKLYNKAIRLKLSTAPARLKQIEAELELIEGELKNLIDFVIRGNASEAINLAIKEREARKGRLLSEGHSLKRSIPNVREITPDEVKQRLATLSETIEKAPLQLYSVVRKMFPRKVRMIPKGKAVDGKNLYRMSGKILLNGGLSSDFERMIENKKGTANDSRSPFVFCEPKKQGFSTHENGVPGSRTTSILKPHSLLVVAIPEKRWKLRKTLELYQQGHSLHEVAKMLGKSREGVRIQLQKSGVIPTSPSGSTSPMMKVRRGKVRWNSPYGFRYERGRAVRHPQEFETFQIIVELRKSGLNSREIADRLNVQRLRPRIAKRWDRCTVHRILGWHEQHPNFLKEIHK